MLTLNINEQRSVDFEVQLSGINPDQLSGALRFKINNIEYGFPAEFKNESIIVNIPPLNNVVIDKLREGTTLKAALEINGNGFYLCPWEGEIKISNPIKMEATIRNVEVDESPKISVSKLVTEDKSGITEEFLDQSIEDKLSEVYNKREKTSKPVIDKPKSKQKEVHLLENVTKEQIYQFMAYRGTKNERVQNVIYEQAENNAKNDDLKEVFKEVYKSLKRK